MADDLLELLPGFNPDGVMGCVVRPTPDMQVYAVPDRGLEVLDVLIDGQPVMYRSPAGHRGRASWSSAGILPLGHIEGAFTSGLENCGPPDGPLPLHGTFSVTPARSWQATPDGGITGQIDCRKLVTGPGIVVQRTIAPIPGRRAFSISDELQATLGGDFMWLYHPNFPVSEGTRFVSSQKLVVPRPDGISAHRVNDYELFANVGRGYTRTPPSTDDPARIDEENFERCYLMKMTPDASGLVRVALVAPDGESAACLEYRPADFMPCQQAFQLWKNPRDAACGLEIGSPFMGWSYARQHALLCHLPQCGRHRFSITIGFLRGSKEVREYTDLMRVPCDVAIRHLQRDELAGIYKDSSSASSASV